MKSLELSRRRFIQGLGATVATVAFGKFVLLPAGCRQGTAFSNRLPVPSLLKNTSTDPNKAAFELAVQKGSTQFFNGKFTATYGYNGSFLGPVLRVKRGQEVSIKVKNILDEVTTVHWHGVLVPGEMDGGPHQLIAAGGEWNPSFIIDQPAATLWYHAHTLGKTGEQVYKGLAGLFIINDEVSQNLSIPRDYGINDIPLVVQDRRFAEDGSLLYMNATDDDLHGMMGDTILVNGAVSPVLEVSTVKMRFRILNASNARIYEFSLSNKNKFSQIASDTGFLESPLELDTMELSPGERAEIIIDFSGYPVGETIVLESPGFKIMEFVVKEKASDTMAIPGKILSVDKIPESAAVKTRSFRFTGGRGNGRYQWITSESQDGYGNYTRNCKTRRYRNLGDN